MDAMIDPIEKGFHIVSIREDEASAPSARERFEQRAADIARAAEQPRHQPAPAPDIPAAPAEHRDDVPFGLRRRIVLRVPILRPAPRAAAASPRGPDGDDEDDEVLLPEDLGCSPDREEVARMRGLLAQVALDLIARVLVINRYFADAGLVKSPEVSVPARPRRPPPG